MKKIIFYLFLFYGISTHVNAQIQKGTKTIGGQISFSSTSVSSTATIGSSSRTESESQTNLSLAPIGGIMITDNIMVGTEVKLVVLGSSSGSGSGIGLLPFGRYYYPAGEKFYIFGELALGFGSVKGGSSSTSFSEWHIGPGASYFLKDNVAIEAALNFNSLKYKDSSLANNSTTLHIGLQFYF